MCVFMYVFSFIHSFIHSYGKIPEIVILMFINCHTGTTQLKALWLSLLCLRQHLPVAVREMVNMETHIHVDIGIVSHYCFTDVYFCLFLYTGGFFLFCWYNDNLKYILALQSWRCYLWKLVYNSAEVCLWFFYSAEILEMQRSTKMVSQ